MADSKNGSFAGPDNNHDYYRAIFDNLPFVAFTLDRKGRFLDGNRYVQKELGIKTKEYQGKSFSRSGLIRKTDILKALLEFRKNLAGKVTGKTVYTLRLKDGRDVLLELSGIPLKKNGKVECILVVGDDITEDVKSKLEVKMHKEFSERLIEASEAVIVGLDKDHFIKLFNHGAELVTGYRKEDVLGKDWFEVFIRPGRIKDVDKAWRAAWGKNYHTYVNPIIIKDGSMREISWHNTSILDDDGKCEMVVSIGLDITERRRIEKALEEKLDELEAFRRISVGREL